MYYRNYPDSGAVSDKASQIGQAQNSVVSPVNRPHAPLGDLVIQTLNDLIERTRNNSARTHHVADRLLGELPPSPVAEKAATSSAVSGIVGTIAEKLSILQTLINVQESAIDRLETLV